MQSQDTQTTMNSQDFSLSFLKGYFGDDAKEEEKFLKALRSRNAQVFRMLLCTAIRKFNTLPLTLEELEDIKKLTSSFDCLIWSDTDSRPSLPLSYLSVNDTLITRTTAEECATIFLILDSNMIHNDFEEHLWDLVMDERGKFCVNNEPIDIDSSRDSDDSERGSEEELKRKHKKKMCDLF